MYFNFIIFLFTCIYVKITCLVVLGLRNERVRDSGRGGGGRGMIVDVGDDGYIGEDLGEEVGELIGEYEGEGE